MAEQTAASDPEQWHRLSPWAVGFLFIRIVVDFVRNNVPARAGAGAGVARIERIGLREVGLFAVAALLAVALVCLLYHRRFRFRLSGDTLLVRRGIIEQTELKVRAGRIQHMAIEQPLYLRLFGLVRLSVDTPGGAAAQVELPGIPAGLAAAIRTRLSRDDDAAEPEAEGGGTGAGELLYRATPAGLTLHGVASNYAYVLAAALAPFLDQLEALLRWLLADTALAAYLQALGERPVLAATALAAAVLATLVGASVAVSWLRFHGFVLLRAAGRFRQRSGLVSHQEQSLVHARLQSVEHVQTAVGRLIGRSYLICRQIGAVLPGQEASGRNFLIPGLDRAGAEQLTAVLWPGVPHAPAFRAVHRYYIRALIVRWSLVTGAVLAAVAGLAASPWPLLGIAAAPPLLWPLAWLRWRAVGYHRAGDYLLVRRGLLGRRTTIFPLVNAQRVALRQSWFQRRRGVATIGVTLASGPVEIPCLPRAEADRLLNLALYRVESRYTAGAPPPAAAGADAAAS